MLRECEHGFNVDLVDLGIVESHLRHRLSFAELRHLL
jgi:hypothetical protein